MLAGVPQRSFFWNFYYPSFEVSSLLQGFESVVLNGGDFAPPLPPQTFSNVQRRFWSAQLGAGRGVLLAPSGVLSRGQGRCWTSYTAQTAPRQRTTQPQMSLVLRVKSPALHEQTFPLSPVLLPPTPNPPKITINPLPLGMHTRAPSQPREGGVTTPATLPLPLPPAEEGCRQRGPPTGLSQLVLNSKMRPSPSLARYQIHLRHFWIYERQYFHL